MGLALASQSARLAGQAGAAPGGRGDAAAAMLVDSAAFPPQNGRLLACAYANLKQPVEMSKGQLAAFRKLYPMNARPVQALNGRSLQQSQ